MVLWQLQEENRQNPQFYAKVGWKMPGLPDKSSTPSKWYSIYGIRLVLAARQVIPKTVNQVLGIQFFHS